MADFDEKDTKILFAARGLGLPVANGVKQTIYHAHDRWPKTVANQQLRLIELHVVFRNFTELPILDAARSQL